MTDDDLMKLMLKADPRCVRIPPGVRAIADEIEAAERERWQSTVEHAVLELDEVDDATAQAQARDLRELLKA